jgi:hypothetical protein
MWNLFEEVIKYFPMHFYVTLSVLRALWGFCCGSVMFLGMMEALVLFPFGYHAYSQLQYFVHS